jgi:hypothetical protein
MWKIVICSSCSHKRELVLSLLSAALCLLWGCASDDVAPKKPRVGAGVQEYRNLAIEAASEITSALELVQRVRQHTGSCPPKLVRDFADEVDDLQVNSIRVRARAQAIQAKGEAYLQAWTTNSALADQPVLPAQSMPQIQDGFVRVKQTSQQVGEIFRPFFSNLRKLRSDLQADPSAVQRDETKKVIQTTNEQGHEVLERLRALEKELQDFQQILRVAMTRGSSS